MFKPIIRVAALSLCCLVLAGGAVRAEEYSPKQLLSFAMELREQGQHDKALDCAKKAAMQVVKQCGTESVACGQYMAVLADFFQSAGKIDAAENFYAGSIQILTRMGKQHPEAIPTLVVVLLQYGLLLKSEGKKEEAGKCLQIALAGANEHGMQNIASQAQAALQSL